MGAYAWGTSTSESPPALPKDLLGLVRHAGTLCLNVESPGWDDARRYLFEDARATLYFPVAKKYLTDDLASFRVLIWSEPRVLAIGELHPATSDQDVEIQMALAAESGIPPHEAQYMLLDQRTKGARKTRHRLVLRELSLAGR
ncbi:MAG TPA: hypothetical protein VM121_02935 [Acidimicrobiales bacterium]|nr:hypothetical protein [Acidimicrobiales bacterium]